MDDGTADRAAMALPEPNLSTMSRAAMWVTAAQVITQVLNVGALVLLGALLPPRAFGTVAVGILVVGTASLVVEAGTRGSLISTPRLASGQIGRALALNAATGIAITVGLIVFAGRLVDTFARDGDVRVLQVLAITIALWSFSVVPLALLQKHLLFREYSIVQIASSLGATVVAVVAVAGGAGVWSLVAREISRELISLALSWWCARDVLDPDVGLRHAAEPTKRRGGHWFLLLTVAQFVAFNVDYVAVGRLTDATRLGLYSFAFNVAFLPLRQFSYQIGAILFSASAATEDGRRIDRQLVVALRVTAIVLIPLLPVAVALAPAVVPAVLGDQWQPMVVPLQLLLIVGVGHAFVNVIGEFLSGSGHIAIRSQFTVVWALVMIVCVPLLVDADGIRGAAMAHLFVAAPFFVVYVVGGVRLVTSGTNVFTDVADGLVVPIAAQVVATAAVTIGLRWSGTSTALAGAAGAVAGLTTLIALWAAKGSSPVRELRAVIGLAIGSPRDGSTRAA
jgi:O-antigen/teichoic acid export membrane protein